MQLDDVAQRRLELFGALQAEGLEHPLLVRARQLHQARHQPGAGWRDAHQGDAPVAVVCQALDLALGFHAVEQPGHGRLLDDR